jgi:hypothetical protein
LYIGRAGLGPIATKSGKMIICFETGTVFVTKSIYKKCRSILSQYES